ncbi:MAG: two-component regulator propeller domain-containing protein [Calditrichia bacterium]
MPGVCRPGFPWISILITLLLSFSTILQAVPQNSRFERLSLKDGLSQSSVSSILQDRQGFLWFATQEGLNKFDGYQFTVYRHDPNRPNTLSDDWINVIHQDHEGMLWVGTAGGGLNRFDPVRENFEVFRHDPADSTSLGSDRVTAIFEDKAGRLWIGTDGGGLNLYHRYKNCFIRRPSVNDTENGLISNRITAIAESPDTNLWIATADSGLAYLDLKKDRLTTYRRSDNSEPGLNSNKILSLLALPEGDVWIGTAGAGLDHFEPSTGSWQNYSHSLSSENGISNNNIYKIFRDADGIFWLATDAGLNRFDSAEERFTVFRHEPFDARSLSHDQIRDVYQDKSGLLWIATFGGGINKFKKNNPFKNYYKNPAYTGSLADNTVWAILKDSRQHLWIGTNDGLDQLPGNQKEFIHHRFWAGQPGGLNQDVVRALAEDPRGRIWAGTDGGGINIFDPETGKIDAYRQREGDPGSLSDNRVRDILRDSRGEMWIATWEGLNRWLPEENRFQHFFADQNIKSTLSDNRIRCLYEDGNGTLWVGTYGGLNYFERKKQRFISFTHHRGNAYSLSNDRVLCVYEDSNGRLWIGTYGGGLNRLDREELIFIRYTQEQGLPNNTVYGILEDDAGFLWLSTNRGLCRFDPELQEFKTYGEQDGLPADEFNGGAYFRSSHGELYFGGIHGFTVFHPEDIKENPLLPPVVLTGFKKFGKQVPLSQLDYQKNGIDLSFRDDFFSFEFAALDFTNPGKNNYYYKLEGFDKDWIYAGNRRFANYTNLDGGHYLFRVKGSNCDGVWNESGLAIPVYIHPPFWQTWWFRLLTAFFLLFAAYLFYKLRLRRIESQKRRLEAEVAQRTGELQQSNLQLLYAKKETDDILNNVEEGLFLLNSNFQIGNQHSAALQHILQHEEIAGRNFFDFLQGKVPREVVANVKEYLELLLRDDVDEESLAELNPLSEMEMIFSGAKEELQRSRYLSFNFKRISEKNRVVNLIVTVEDVTEQVLLARELARSQEQNQRQMEWLISILHVEPPLLKEFMNSVHEELQAIAGMFRNSCGEGEYLSILDNAYRAMHLIKGNASLLDLNFFVTQAHQFEEEISHLKKKAAVGGKDFVALSIKLANLQKTIFDVQKLIRKMQHFHEQYQSQQKGQEDLLIRSLQRLLERLAGSLGKSVRLDAQNFDYAAIPYRHRLLLKDVLIQLARNSLSHGIEAAAERELAGKPAYGTLSLWSEINAGDLVIGLRDDGRGIQVEKLREIARSSGRWKPEEVNGWSSREVAGLIFETGISTAEQADNRAGRGIGMDAVKLRLQKAGGSIDMQFSPGQFCEFLVRLPLHSLAGHPEKNLQPVSAPLN